MSVPMSDCDIFDYYRTSRCLTMEESLDFVSVVQDTPNPKRGALAVSGVTLSLIENGWNEERMLMLVNALRNDNDDVIRERAIVGLLLVMMQYDSVIRSAGDMLDKVQDVLTENPDLAFTALCNIARTQHVDLVLKCNQRLAKDLLPLIQERKTDEFVRVINQHKNDMLNIARLHLDQNFVFFQDAYQLPFFRERAAHWFLPWDEHALLNVPEEYREDVAELLSRWAMCDSDKYALISNGMYNALRNAVQDRLQIESLRDIGNAMEMQELVTNGYVQQLYRFFRLSAFTRSHPFDLAKNMRQMIVFRLVVVGRRAQDIIGELL